MGLYDADTERQHALAMAALGEGSDESSSIFENALAAIAKGSSPTRFIALAELFKELNRSGLWPKLDPLETAMKGAKHSGSPNAPAIFKFFSSARLARAFIQMSTRFGADFNPDIPLAQASAHLIALLEHAVAVCMEERWRRMPSAQAALEIAQVKSGALGISISGLASVAERFIISHDVACAPSRAPAARL
jgi:hypothetical protein